jgi:5-methylcytosine-specific restriction endonuclease McrA
MSYEPKWKKKRIKLDSAEYHELQKRVFERDGWSCKMCGSGLNLHMHHVGFRSHQGDDSDDNCVTLCWKCHELVHKNKIVRDELNKKLKTLISRDDYGRVVGREDRDNKS